MNCGSWHAPSSSHLLQKMLKRIERQLATGEAKELVDSSENQQVAEAAQEDAAAQAW